VHCGIDLKLKALMQNLSSDWRRLPKIVVLSFATSLPMILLDRLALP
jgi:hypothetical protein